MYTLNPNLSPFIFHLTIKILYFKDRSNTRRHHVSDHGPPSSWATGEPSSAPAAEAAPSSDTAVPRAPFYLSHAVPLRIHETLTPPPLTDAAVVVPGQHARVVWSRQSVFDMGHPSARRVARDPTGKLPHVPLWSDRPSGPVRLPDLL
jgi:hypothetical protein